MRIKIGESNFGEFMVIRQIRQSFPPPMFPSIWYVTNQNKVAFHIVGYFWWSCHWFVVILWCALTSLWIGLKTCCELFKDGLVEMN